MEGVQQKTMAANTSKTRMPAKAIRLLFKVPSNNYLFAD
jgi:hypothetical protein